MIDVLLFLLASPYCAEIAAEATERCWENRGNATRNTARRGL